MLSLLVGGCCAMVPHGVICRAVVVVVPCAPDNETLRMLETKMRRTSRKPRCIFVGCVCVSSLCLRLCCVNVVEEYLTKKDIVIAYRNHKHFSRCRCQQRIFEITRIQSGCVSQNKHNTTNINTNTTRKYITYFVKLLQEVKYIKLAKQKRTNDPFWSLFFGLQAQRWILVVCPHTAISVEVVWQSWQLTNALWNSSASLACFACLGHPLVVGQLFSPI